MLGKKYVSVLLAFVLVLTLIPSTTSLAVENDGVVWLQEEMGVRSNFSEGLAVVVKDNKYGYIDKTGKVVIPIIYEDASPFSEGLAAVWKDNKCGFIERNGNVVIPFIYRFAGQFSEGLAMVKNGPDSYGYIDATGKVVVPLIYDYNSSTYFQEGFAMVCKDWEYGIVDRNGDFVVPLKQRYVSSVNEGLALVVNGWKKIGYIDTTNNLVIPYTYEYAGAFSEGLAAVWKDNKYGYIDKTGKEIVPFLYNYVDNFREGFACVGKDKKKGFVDKTGREVVPLIYDDADSFSEGLAAVSVNGGQGTAISNPGKQGYVDTNGNVVVPLIYDRTGPFSEGLAVVGYNGPVKQGCIDKTGKVIVPLIYDGISQFTEGVAIVTKDFRTGILFNPLSAPTAQAQNATPTSSEVLVNGKEIAFNAYNIEDYNYFKIRDIAMAINGTAKQFDVVWDGEKNAINLISARPYATNGSELAPPTDKTAQTATPTTSAIYMDGKAIILTAYNINGYNYFKLRDLGKALGFNVSWDTITSSIVIDTNNPYTGE